MKIAMPGHGNLEAWSRQGVLMLNTVLTVRKGDANSHQKKGYVLLLLHPLLRHARAAAFPMPGCLQRVGGDCSGFASHFFGSVCDGCVMILCRWEDFTDAVVRVLAKKKQIVYLLWGNPAQQK